MTCYYFDTDSASDQARRGLANVCQKYSIYKIRTEGAFCVKILTNNFPAICAKMLEKIFEHILTLCKLPSFFRFLKRYMCLDMAQLNSKEGDLSR